MAFSVSNEACEAPNRNQRNLSGSRFVQRKRPWQLPSERLFDEQIVRILIGEEHRRTAGVPE